MFAIYHDAELIELNIFSIIPCRCWTFLCVHVFNLTRKCYLYSYSICELIFCVLLTVIFAVRRCSGYLIHILIFVWLSKFFEWTSLLLLLLVHNTHQSILYNWNQYWTIWRVIDGWTVPRKKGPIMCVTQSINKNQNNQTEEKSAKEWKSGEKITIT